MVAVVSPAHHSPFKVPVHVPMHCAQLLVPGSKENTLGGDDTCRIAHFADRSNTNRNTCIADLASKRRSLSKRLLGHTDCFDRMVCACALAKVEILNRLERIRKMRRNDAEIDITFFARLPFGIGAKKDHLLYGEAIFLEFLYVAGYDGNYFSRYCSVSHTKSFLDFSK